ncbi:tetratricopeptide repeat-containing diguanylate cyclase, partial [Vibrio genomosp. F10]
MSKKFISKKIRWVGSITVVIVLFIFTIDVFLFRFNVASTPIEPVALSLEQQLADSAIGRELVSIRPLIDESPALAKKAIHALLLSNKSQDLKTIEQIYVLLLRRDIAISERQELAATEINQQLSHLANQKNIPWLQALLEIEQAE